MNFIEGFLVGILILISALLISNFTTDKFTDQINQRGFVQAVCDTSHHTINGGNDLEQRCAKAQDKYHMEYLCAERSITSACWTERK